MGGRAREREDGEFEDEQRIDYEYEMTLVRSPSLRKDTSKQGHVDLGYNLCQFMPVIGLHHPDPLFILSDSLRQGRFCHVVKAPCILSRRPPLFGNGSSGYKQIS